MAAETTTATTTEQLCPATAAVNTTSTWSETAEEAGDA